MKTGKKILAGVICVAVIAGGGTGGILFYRSRQAEKHKVDVYAVSSLVDGYWGDDLTMDGKVVAGDVQNVILGNDQMIEKVLVKEGDHVTAGTPLIQYDQTAAALDAAQKKTALAVAEDNVRQQEKELERIKKLKPSEEAPAEPDYPDYPDDPDVPDDPDAPDTPVSTLAEVSALTQAAAGSGSAEDPYQFSCTGATVVKQAVLEQLKNTGGCAVFVVYDTAGNSLYAWLVKGSDLSAAVLSDWTLGSQVTVTEDGGVQIHGGGSWYGTIQVGGDLTYDPISEPHTTTPAVTTDAGTHTQTETDTTPAEPETSTEPQAAPTAVIRPMAAIVPLASTASSDADNYAYTRAQLKQKAAEQEIQIQSAKIEQKKAQLEYDSAAEKQSSGQEVAKIDGTVTKVAESAESLEKNEPYLVVQGSGGVLIQGTVSEMNLKKLTVGSTIQVNSWESGESVSAEVTEVGTTPTSDSGQNYGENPNNSMYPFQAAVTEESSLSIGNGISISISSMEESNHFYIPMSYVRQENGQYYVMKKSKSGTLEKQVIQTGKIINGGYSIEVISGISEDDRICFPYGKYVTEGAKTKDSNEIAY